MFLAEQIIYGLNELNEFMPASDELLSGLGEIANNGRVLAVIWHAYFSALVLALALGVRPSARLGGLLLSLPLFSVSVLAWAQANPFNATLFAVLGTVTLSMPARHSERLQTAPWWAVSSGALLFAFGWIYPHFVETPSTLTYLYASPLGLIPCPTLCAVIGIGLMLRGLGSYAWMVVLGAAGVFYGIFGAARLGVTLDWVLVAGALMMLFYMVAAYRARRA